MAPISVHARGKICSNSAARGHLLGAGVGHIYLYWPSTRNDFTNIDDGSYIVENSHVNSDLSAANVSWAFGHPYAGYSIPLTRISHMLDCQLFGLNPGGHHLMNALYHTANALLLFLLLTNLTGATWREDSLVRPHHLQEPQFPGRTVRGGTDHGHRLLRDDDVPVAELAGILDALLALDVWPDSYDGGPEFAAALKNLTSELIGRFCIAAQQATLDRPAPAAHPLRRRPHRAAPPAARVRPAQGHHGALRDDPRRSGRGAGAGSGNCSPS